MKRHILVLCKIFLIVLLFSFHNSFAQWEPDIRITDDSFLSWTNTYYAPAVGATGNTVHIVFTDNSSGVVQGTRYLRSPDSGVTWDRDTILSSAGNPSENSSLTTNGQYVFVVWEDYRYGQYEIFFKSSSDAGTTWVSDERISNTSLESETPSVASSGSDVHVVYRDHGLMQAGEIRYRRSTNNGNFWNINTQLTNDPGVSEYPKVAASGQIVHVVWSDGRDGNYEIYYKRSSDRGVNWGSDTRMTLDVNYSSLPQVAVSGSIVHLFWQDNRDGQYEIFYKHSTDEGLSWSSDIILTDDTFNSYVPTIAVSGSVIHLVWMDERDGNREIYHKRSTDDGTTWSNDERLTTTPENFEGQSVTLFDQTVYIVWTDYRDNSDGEIYFKRNPTGEPTDVEITDANVPSDFYLFQNYPNPFNPVTNIEFQVAYPEFISLKIYDVLGNEIASLVSQNLSAGFYKTKWNAGDLASGIYICRLGAGLFSQSRKLLLMK